VRITDERAGWSIDMPAGWFERVARATRGRELRNYDPRGVAADGNIPPPGGVLVRIELLPNVDGYELERFADSHVWTGTCRDCRKIVERADVALGGEPAKFFSVWQNQPGAFADLEPNLYWLVHSPFFADRVLVLRAIPAASPARSDVERMVSSLQFFRPAPPALVPTRTRQQVIDFVRSPGRTITRIEAKLMLWSEWERAHNEVLRAAGGGPGGVRSARDPDTLVWVVAYTGSGFTPMKGGPPGPGTVPATPVAPPQWDWAVSVLPATDPFDWGGPTLGGFGASWPSWFDKLTDRTPVN
jgi:hypothetical protein